MSKNFSLIDWQGMLSSLALPADLADGENLAEYLCRHFDEPVALKDVGPLYLGSKLVEWNRAKEEPLIVVGYEQAVAVAVLDIAKHAPAKDYVPLHKFEGLVEEVRLKDAEIKRLAEQVKNLQAYRDGESGDGVWHWQGNGEDHLESLSCPVVIRADDLRALVAKTEPSRDPAWAKYDPSWVVNFLRGETLFDANLIEAMLNFAKGVKRKGGAS